eukprot:1161529-Pelagomonas_calceolata.AAC.29
MGWDGKGPGNPVLQSHNGFLIHAFNKKEIYMHESSLKQVGAWLLKHQAFAQHVYDAYDSTQACCMGLCSVLFTRQGLDAKSPACY